MKFCSELQCTLRIAALSLGSLLLGSGPVLGATGDTLYGTAISVGDAASANVNSIVFDGRNIWVGVEDSSGGWVKKLGASGAIISSTQVGIAPLQMVYDGARIWVTDYASSDITILGADGGVVKTIQLAPSANPEGILFDGKYIWVANNGVGANSVSKYDSTTMTLIREYIVGLDPDGLAFDGTYIWVTNSYGNNVVKLNRDTGEILRTYPTGVFPLSVVFDGTNMWIAIGADADFGPPINVTGSVMKLRANGGINLGTFPVGSVVRGLAYDGTSIWICNSHDNTFTRLRATDGARLGTYPAGGAPRSMAFDGKHMWIANSGDNTVSVITSSPDDPSFLPLVPIQTAADVDASTTLRSTSKVNAAALGAIASMLLGDN